MIVILLVIHIMVAISLVAVILLQKSEGGALGMGGGGMSGLMTGRSTANLLTRSTAILLAAFLMNRIALALLAARKHNTTGGSILDRLAPHTAPASPANPAPKPVSPPTPATPSVPLAK